MRYNPVNNYIMAVQSMLEAMEGTYALSTKVLLRKDCALSTNVLEVVLYMLCVLELLWGAGVATYTGGRGKLGTICCMYCR